MFLSHTFEEDLKKDNFSWSWFCK